MYIYIYIYIYVCECLCACAYLRALCLRARVCIFYWPSASAHSRPVVIKRLWHRPKFGSMNLELGASPVKSQLQCRSMYSGELLITTWGHWLCYSPPHSAFLRRPHHAPHYYRRASHHLFQCMWKRLPSTRECWHVQLFRANASFVFARACYFEMWASKQYTGADVCWCLRPDRIHVRICSVYRNISQTSILFSFGGGTLDTFPRAAFLEYWLESPVAQGQLVLTFVKPGIVLHRTQGAGGRISYQTAEIDIPGPWIPLRGSIDWPPTMYRTWRKNFDHWRSPPRPRSKSAWRNLPSTGKDQCL